MKLSPNFTLEELTRTSYPRLQDVPTELQVMNMVYLCAAVLQPLRDELGRPVSITSGYRSARLNAHVGGVPNSAHLNGLAADIHVDSDDDARQKFEILKATESASCGRQRIVRARQERLTLAARADEAHQPATTAGQLQL